MAAATKKAVADLNQVPGTEGAADKRSALSAELEALLITVMCSMAGALFEKMAFLFLYHVLLAGLVSWSFLGTTCWLASA